MRAHVVGSVLAILAACNATGDDTTDDSTAVPDASLGPSSCVAPPPVEAFSGPVRAAPSFTRIALPIALDYTAHRAAVFDVDADGDDDLFVQEFEHIATGPYMGRTRVWTGDGTGTFVDASASFVPMPIQPMLPNVLAHADLDGDGTEDVVAGQVGVDCADPSCSGAPVQLLAHRAAGFADIAPSVLMPYDEHSVTFGVAVADVNCDGHPDIFLSNLPPTPMRMYLANGDGTWADHRGLPSDLADRNFMGQAFCDIDRDGAPDLYLGAIGNQPDRLLRNTGHGWFRDWDGELPDRAASGGDVTSVTCADYDLDGWDDILVLWNKRAGAAGFVQILRNDRGTLVESGLSQSLSARHEQLWVADFNGDRWPDLLLTKSPELWTHATDGGFVASPLDALTIYESAYPIHGPGGRIGVLAPHTTESAVLLDQR